MFNTCETLSQALNLFNPHNNPVLPFFHFTDKETQVKEHGAGKWQNWDVNPSDGGSKEPAVNSQDTTTSKSKISLHNHPPPALNPQDTAASKSKFSLHNCHPCPTEMYLCLLTLLLWHFNNGYWSTWFNCSANPEALWGQGPLPPLYLYNPSPPKHNAGAQESDEWIN